MSARSCAGSANPTRRSRRRRWRIGVTALTVAASLAAVGCSARGPQRSGAVPASPSAAETYGGLPTYLPKSALQPDAILTATAGHPALTTEGDAVEAHLADSVVLTTVTGPVVPGEGLPNQPETTTCTWTVTLRSLSGTAPINPADFTTLDHLGHVFHPRFVTGRPLPPTHLGPNQSATFDLRAVMPSGEGLMRWAPPPGPILASWDFEVEND